MSPEDHNILQKCGFWWPEVDENHKQPRLPLTLSEISMLMQIARGEERGKILAIEKVAKVVEKYINKAFSCAIQEPWDVSEKYGQFAAIEISSLFKDINE